MICPHCNGEKKRLVFACPGFRPMLIDCDGCKGTGVVDDQAPDWIARGAACKQRRIHLSMTLRSFCLDGHMNPAHCSRMERGMEDPTELEEALSRLEVAP